ncbi:hypothetical protein QYE76_049498 [Lolium multiflorum]|uniref:Transposase-associated domain-containing protein n=1 Tax=Lolium multiflorum TaxID=4521 RepID=A0AAD8SPA1_LOLMU|nr:hypothetical protein QYE76_049498 [Lolium multiflorum]
MVHQQPRRDFNFVGHGNFSCSDSSDPKTSELPRSPPPLSPLLVLPRSPPPRCWLPPPELPPPPSITIDNTAHISILPVPLHHYPANPHASPAGHLAALLTGSPRSSRPPRSSHHGPSSLPHQTTFVGCLHDPLPRPSSRGGIGTAAPKLAELAARLACGAREGVNSFLLVAEANKSKQGFMCCPCLKCKNEKDYSCSRDIKSHLLRFGFMSSYNVWTKHGEEGVMMEDGDEEEDNDDQYRSMFSECFDTAMDDNEEEGGEEQASDDPVDDDLRRAISDARRDCGTDKERLQFDKMLEDHHKLLYPGCEDGHRKLGSILELLKWKAEVGVTDSGFEKLMIILKKLFPRNNELPVSTYEAKKLVCPLGLDVQKIHACINDCILYRGEKYENLNKCPICGALRYKIRKDDPGDVEGEPPRKRVPAKVMWYAPIIPRLKRLFRNKEHAQLLRWHMEERKKDAMLRHPADGRQWRNIGREFPDFAGEARNLYFGLSTDGMNPFGEQSCSHSTWPVTLCIYNLPPWLCMKRKFIMMPVLIQGPKQPGNDIDVYLRPLVDELLELWAKPGVRVWDEHTEQEFDLRGLLFVTINDWPALS